ncbi:isocitrate lyase/PEP mutase family protein [Actinocatenispora comari]|nr:isocitrate lyase/phosphoenolpyruvate mutase family protein [Actinocatenispora comari]
MTDVAGDPTMAERVERFRALHRAGAPLVLPNAWDHASGAALARAGFAAIGTTSLGVAAAAGSVDATGATRSTTVHLARRLARLPVLVTVDIEAGFGAAPADVAALVAELAAAGVVGVNIEDGRPDGTLAPLADQCELVRAAGSSGLFVNARTDTYWLPGAPVAETGRRLAAYRDAGADGLFVPGLRDPGTIAGLARDLPLPLNVLAMPELPVARLAELGVRRISTGSLLFRAALGAALDTARAVAAGTPLPTGLPSYDEAASYATDFG